MKQLLLSFALFFAALNTFAHGDDANPNITPFNGVADGKASVAHLLKQQAWKDFTQKYPTWGARFNRYTGLPHRSFGAPISFAPGGSDPVAKAKAFLQTELAGFHLPVEELVLTRSQNDGKYLHVDFKQFHKGLEVLWSRTTVRFSQNLQVVLFGTDLYRNITLPNATLSAAQAIQQAEQALVTPVTSSSVDPSLKIFPLTVDGQVDFRPVYAVTVETQDDAVTPGQYLTYVDAVNGTILYRQNKVKHVGFVVKSDVYPTNLFSPLVNTPLPHLLITYNAASYYTDANGLATIAGAGPINATLTLSGRYSKVVTGANGTTSPTFAAAGIANNAIVQFPQSTPNATERHFTAYYHVNVVHDYMKAKFPTFTTMDNPLTTRVDRTDGNCNAFYNGTSINFYTTANGCNALSQVNTVVYHEYGHGISDKFWTANGSSFDNGAMGEGYSDVWSMVITKDPIVGQGFYINQPNSYIRRYDINPKVYPFDIQGEVHADGEIIAGAWWDYAVNLSSGMSLSNAVDSMSDLFAASQFGLATGPDGTEGQVYYDILIDALQYDDDNNNINDGTPHFLDIVEAFKKHGIYLLSNAALFHNPPGVVGSGQTVTLNADAIVDFPAFLGDVKMFYRPKGGTLIDSLLMVKTGTSFTGSFPSANAGDIFEYYFTIYDNTNFPSANAPVDARFNITLSQRNIPHYLMVGYASMFHDNFDNVTTTAGGWTVGDVAGDNATTGKWIIAVPVSSKTTAGDTVQTGADHTASGPSQGKCAVTGNAASPTSQPGSADVDNGRTSMVTATLDLTPYTRPVISYWRWFSNSQGSNPKKDPWRVYSSYDNGTTWTLIERTYMPDVSWRRYVWEPNKANGNNVRLMFVASDSVQGAGGSWIEGAVDDLQIFDLGNATALGEVSTLSTQVFPNPAREQLNILLPLNGSCRYTLFNALGQSLRNGKETAAAGQRISLNTEGLAEGIYLLRVEQGGKQSLHRIRISR